MRCRFSMCFFILLGFVWFSASTYFGCKWAKAAKWIIFLAVVLAQQHQPKRNKMEFPQSVVLWPTLCLSMTVTCSSVLQTSETRMRLIGLVRDKPAKFRLLKVRHLSLFLDFFPNIVPHVLILHSLLQKQTIDSMYTQGIILHFVVYQLSGKLNLAILSLFHIADYVNVFINAGSSSPGGNPDNACIIVFYCSLILFFIVFSSGIPSLSRRRSSMFHGQRV